MVYSILAHFIDTRKRSQVLSQVILFGLMSSLTLVVGASNACKYGYSVSIYPLYKSMTKCKSKYRENGMLTASIHSTET